MFVISVEKYSHLVYVDVLIFPIPTDIYDKHVFLEKTTTFELCFCVVKVFESEQMGGVWRWLELLE